MILFLPGQAIGLSSTSGAALEVCGAGQKAVKRVERLGPDIGP
jgi:hypothetical protein